MKPQKILSAGDANEGGVLETEHALSTKGDSSIEMSWANNPVRSHSKQKITAYKSS